jgi:hypothetical protein
LSSSFEVKGVVHFFERGYDKGGKEAEMDKKDEKMERLAAEIVMG